MLWYEINPKRFGDEVQLLKSGHPKSRIFVQKGRLTVYLKINDRIYSYLAGILYPDDFPYSPPKAYILRPKIANLFHEIHRYADSSLCLARPEEISLQTSGKTFCDWVKDWVKGYEIWLETGEFPLGRR